MRDKPQGQELPVDELFQIIGEQVVERRLIQRIAVDLEKKLGSANQRIQELTAVMDKINKEKECKKPAKK